MAPKKQNPKNAAGLGAAAVALAVKALKSPEVQAQLRRAPAVVMAWAADNKRQSSGGGAGTTLARFNPADRFGQRGLERRIEKLGQNFTLTFGEREDTSRPEMWAALDELQKATTVAAGLPALKRKKMQMRIDDELDELEAGLMNALLPKP